MPIAKVPIVHKFGIISHSQRLELQERLLKQSYIRTLEARKTITNPRNPLEVTEEFVQEFNNVPNLEEQEKKEALARKMIERIKRRAGLKIGGSGAHVDLPIAWTELAQLAQCKGPIQEECLDILITSLDQAPLEKNHTPALFYLAETTLYWLRTEAIHQPYLRTGELKLLRMGQLVFTHLFYHHMAGQLQGQHDFKNRLFTYLDGFGECQEAYAPYPNALLSLRYINEVGKMIIGDFNTEAGEIKDGDSHSHAAKERAPTEKTDSEDCDLFHEVSAQFESTGSSQSGAISSSVHDLSPTLWHALDVWRCVTKKCDSLPSALRSLGNCAMGLASESWIDGIGAMLILADSAKINNNALKTMQNLARGVRPPPRNASVITSVRTTEDSVPLSSRTVGEIQESSSEVNKLALSDIYEKTEENFTTTDTDQGRSSMLTEGQRKEILKPKESTSLSEEDKGINPTEPTSTNTPGAADAEMVQTNTPGYDPVPNTAWAAEAGTDLPSGRASEASSVPTYSNQVFPEVPGIHGWHWEVAVAYIDALSDICLHGSTSTIQKNALLGHNKSVEDRYRQAMIPQCPLPSAGLLDLAYFHAKQESHDQGPNDWSWRVRYSAIQGLVKICRCCANNSNKDGMRTVAWNTLLKANSTEKDTRVLEALKVGQVDANIENLIQSHLVVLPNTIGAKMASGLSALYLPALPPPVQASTSGRPWEKNKVKKVINHPTSRKAMRTTLGEEILLATALYEPQATFNTRTNFDLKRIVEDQWRKDLQQELEEEEEEKQKELKKKQKEEEEERKRIEENRAEKLGKKNMGTAYQYKTPSGHMLHS